MHNNGQSLNLPPDVRSTIVSIVYHVHTALMHKARIDTHYKAINRGQFGIHSPFCTKRASSFINYTTFNYIPHGI